MSPSEGLIFLPLNSSHLLPNSGVPLLFPWVKKFSFYCIILRKIFTLSATSRLNNS